MCKISLRTPLTKNGVITLDRSKTEEVLFLEHLVVLHLRFGFIARYRPHLPYTQKRLFFLILELFVHFSIKNIFNSTQNPMKFTF